MERINVEDSLFYRPLASMWLISIPFRKVDVNGHAGSATIALRLPGQLSMNMKLPVLTT